MTNSFFMIMYLNLALFPFSRSKSKTSTFDLNKEITKKKTSNFFLSPDPIFFTLHLFWSLFFQGRKQTHDFKTRIVGAD